MYLQNTSSPPCNILDTEDSVNIGQILINAAAYTDLNYNTIDVGHLPPNLLMPNFTPICENEFTPTINNHNNTENMKWSKVKELSDNISALASSFLSRPFNYTVRQEEIDRVMHISEKMHSEIKEIADRSYINPGTFPCTQTIPYEYSTMPGKRMLLPAIPGTQPVNTVSRSQQVTEDTKKRRKRGRIPVDKSGFCCMNCGTKETPEWRRGPAGRNTYCNACGMRYSKQNKKKKGSGEQEASPLDLSFSPTSQFEKKLTSASKTRKE